MSWRETDREKFRGWWFVHWRCAGCGKRAVTGGETPTPCACATQPAMPPRRTR